MKDQQACGTELCDGRSDSHRASFESLDGEILQEPRFSPHLHGEEIKRVGEIRYRLGIGPDLP